MSTSYILLVASALFSVISFADKVRQGDGGTTIIHPGEAPCCCQKHYDEGGIVVDCNFPLTEEKPTCDDWSGGPFADVHIDPETGEPVITGEGELWGCHDNPNH